jgi:hypothetical protein
MFEYWTPALLFIAALVINLPFGYLRARQKPRCLKWFLYIHIPIPFVVMMRYMVDLGIGFLPVSLAGAVLGQFLGGRLRLKGGHAVSG